MMNLKVYVQVGLVFFSLISCSKTVSYDVVVVGGSTSGVAASVQAARMGRSTLLISETEWLGGMLTSAGVSAVDGNYRLPAGIWGEFLDALSEHYGGLDALKTGWVSNVLFEPKVGNEIFQTMVEAEERLTLMTDSNVLSVSKSDKGWNLLLERDGSRVRVHALRLIDATELGDVAKACGAAYDTGMESRSETGEKSAPRRANGIIQDLTYVAVLKDYGHDVSMAEPEGYDKWEFAGCCDNPLCVSPKEPNRIWPVEMMLSYGRLPGGKYMLNWPIEGNDYYLDLLEMNPSERTEALKEAKLHTLRFVYFIQHELGYVNIGIADDEFPTADGLPFIPYHRESRRVKGVVRFTVNDILSPFRNDLYRTGIAVGDYPVDQHHMRYSGKETLPDLHFCSVPSFSLPLGALIPRGVEDLVVAEKSVSVSNIANGATRLQPVVLQIGQAAGALASLSLSYSCSVDRVPVRAVQEAVLDSGGYLLPYLDVPKTDPRFRLYQRIGAAGILRGEGRTADWRGECWLNVSEPLLEKHLKGLDVYDALYAGQGVAAYGPKTDVDYRHGKKKVTLGRMLQLIQYFRGSELPEIVSSGVSAGGLSITMNEYTLENLTECCSEYGENRLKEALLKSDMNYRLSRGEGALLIDVLLDPFHNIPVDIYGHVVSCDGTV